MNEAPTKKRGGNGNGWKRGQSGNPAGRPIGSRNRMTVWVETLGANCVVDIMLRLYDLALGGNLIAMKIILDKFVPNAKEDPIDFPLPSPTTAKQAAENIHSINEAVCCGNIMPSQGEQLIRMQQASLNAIDVVELEVRLAEVEKMLQEIKPA